MQFRTLFNYINYKTIYCTIKSFEFDFSQKMNLGHYQNKCLIYVDWKFRCTLIRISTFSGINRMEQIQHFLPSRNVIILLPDTTEYRRPTVSFPDRVYLETRTFLYRCQDGPWLSAMMRISCVLYKDWRTGSSALFLLTSKQNSPICSKYRDTYFTDLFSLPFFFPLLRFFFGVTREKKSVHFSTLGVSLMPQRWCQLLFLDDLNFFRSPFSLVSLFSLDFQTIDRSRRTFV